MFGIGFTELLLVLVVALLVLGPDKLPEVARTVAKAYNELRRTGLDIKRTVEGTVRGIDLTDSAGKGAGAASGGEDKGEGEAGKSDSGSGSGDGPGKAD